MAENTAAPMATVVRQLEDELGALDYMIECKRDLEVEKRQRTTDLWISETFKLPASAVAGALARQTTEEGFRWGASINYVVGIVAKAGVLAQPKARAAAVTASALSELLHGQISVDVYRAGGE